LTKKTDQLQTKRYTPEVLITLQFICNSISQPAENTVYIAPMPYFLPRENREKSN